VRVFDMQASYAIRERRSVRAFLPDPVPVEIVRQILTLAKWAPSWGNTQDWNAHVIDGAVLQRLKAALTQLADEGAPSFTDLPMPSQEWPAYLAARMETRHLPVARDLSAGEPSVSHLYGAPTLVVFAIDADLEPTYACFDAGLLVQTFCLVAEDLGYATCITAAAVRYADVLHELIPQADGQRFVVGVALGLVDHTAVVNRGDRGRVNLSEWVSFSTDAFGETEEPED
jgi:nitroreductase